MEKKRTFDALTGLKGIFMFFIVLFHSLPDTELIQKIPLTSFIRIYGGDLGNYMFFMLSGFLMSWSYRDRIGIGEISFGRYIVKRLKKLYPLYLLSNAVMLATDVYEYGWSAVNLKRIVLTILLQNGGGLETTRPYNGPSWFVSALVVCYMAYYFVAYISKNKTQYIALLAFGIIWGYSIVEGGWTPPLNFARSGVSFLTFFTGCMLAEVYPLIQDRYRNGIQLGVFAVLAGSGYLLLRYGVGIISGSTRVAFAFVICPLVLYLALEKNPLSWILKSRPVLWLGKISMSVYFWHFVIYIIFRIIWNRYSAGAEIGDAQYAVYLILVVVLGALSNRFLEAPLKR